MGIGALTAIITLKIGSRIRGRFHDRKKPVVRREIADITRIRVSIMHNTCGNGPERCDKVGRKENLISLPHRIVAVTENVPG